MIFWGSAFLEPVAFRQITNLIAHVPNFIGKIHSFAGEPPSCRHLKTQLQSIFYSRTNMHTPPMFFSNSVGTKIISQIPPICPIFFSSSGHAGGSSASDGSRVLCVRPGFFCAAGFLGPETGCRYGGVLSHVGDPW